MSTYAVYDSKLRGFITEPRATRADALRDKAALGHQSRHTVRRVPTDSAGARQR